jgi:hypothetical protein
MGRTVTPTLTVAATYVTGDYVGTSGVAMVFTGMVGNTGLGIVNGAILIDAASQSLALELWLFDTAVTPPADSAAWTISDADMKSLVCVIPFAAASYYASAANSVCFGAPVDARIYELNTFGSLYGCLVTRGSPAYASGDLTVRLSTAPL